MVGVLGASPDPFAAAFADKLTARSPGRGCDASLLSAIATEREPMPEMVIVMVMSKGGGRWELVRVNSGGDREGSR